MNEWLHYENNDGMWMIARVKQMHTWIVINNLSIWFSLFFLTTPPTSFPLLFFSSFSFYCFTFSLALWPGRSLSLMEDGACKPDIIAHFMCPTVTALSSKGKSTSRTSATINLVEGVCANSSWHDHWCDVEGRRWRKNFKFQSHSTGGEIKLFLLSFV